jgi:hypothetical protein
MIAGAVGAQGTKRRLSGNDVGNFRLLVRTDLLGVGTKPFPKRAAEGILGSLSLSVDSRALKLAPRTSASSCWLSSAVSGPPLGRDSMNFWTESDREGREVRGARGPS